MQITVGRAFARASSSLPVLQSSPEQPPIQRQSINDFLLGRLESDGKRDGKAEDEIVVPEANNATEITSQVSAEALQTDVEAAPGVDRSLPADGGSPLQPAKRRRRAASCRGLAEGTEMQGTVLRFTKKMVYVDLGGGRSARLNITPSLAHRLRSGERLALVVESVDHEADEATVALTPGMNVEVAGRAPDRKPIAEFEVGMVVDGYVQSRGAMGVFFDAHATEGFFAPWSSLGNRTARLRVGDHVRLNITKVRVPKGRVRVAVLDDAPSREAALEAPDGSPSRLPVEAPIEGTVFRITSSRVYADIGRGKAAQLNINPSLATRLRSGERLALVVESVDHEANETTVSLTPAMEEEVAGRSPDRKPLAEFEVGMEVDGYAQSITSLGVFFDAHATGDLLAPWSALGRRGKRLRTGDRVRLRVTTVDLKRGRVFVAMVGKVRRRGVVPP